LLRFCGSRFHKTAAVTAHTVLQFRAAAAGQQSFLYCFVSGLLLRWKKINVLLYGTQQVALTKVSKKTAFAVTKLFHII